MISVEHDLPRYPVGYVMSNISSSKKSAKDKKTKYIYIKDKKYIKIYIKQWIKP